MCCFSFLTHVYIIPSYELVHLCIVYCHHLWCLIHDLAILCTQSTTNKRRQQWCLCRRKNNQSTLYCYDLFMCMSNVMLTRDYWQDMVLVLYIRILINMFPIIKIQVNSKWAFPKRSSALIIVHCQCKYLSYSCLMSES